MWFLCCQVICVWLDLGKSHWSLWWWIMVDQVKSLWARGVGAAIISSNRGIDNDTNQLICTRINMECLLSLYGIRSRLIFSYPNSIPVLLLAILTDETGQCELNPLSSLISFLALSYLQDWSVCSRSSIVYGSSEAPGEYVFSSNVYTSTDLSYEQGPKEVSSSSLLSLPGKSTFTKLRHLLLIC